MSLSYSSLFRQKQGQRAFTVAYMAKYVPLARIVSSDMPVLDIGCGWGHLLEALVNSSIPCLGIDTCEGQIAEATAHGCPAIYVADSLAWVREQGAAGRRWSTIFLMDVLEHLESDRQIDLLHSLHEILPQGGRLVIKCPNPDSAVGIRMAFSDYTHRFTPTADALEDVLAALGFNSIRIGDELPWGDTPNIGIRPMFLLGTPETRKKSRHDLFYAVSQTVFRTVRRWQIASEIGLEAARGLPLTPNFLCIAEK